MLGSVHPDHHGAVPEEQRRERFVVVLVGRAHADTEGRLRESAFAHANDRYQMLSDKSRVNLLSR
jgi:hypothetical protein